MNVPVGVTVKREMRHTVSYVEYKFGVARDLSGRGSVIRALPMSPSALWSSLSWYYDSRTRLSELDDYLSSVKVDVVSVAERCIEVAIRRVSFAPPPGYGDTVVGLAVAERLPIRGECYEVY